MLCGVEMKCFFKIKRGIKFEKLMKAYCERRSLVPRAVRFLHNGSCVESSNAPELVCLSIYDPSLLNISTYFAQHR